MKYFTTIVTENLDKFFATLEPNILKKVFYNIDKAEETNDPKLFKKINKEIWEFRTKFSGFQIRLLAFWDKTEFENTLVIVTNGFIKKTEKTPVVEIEKAMKMRKKYFEEKISTKK